MRAFGWSAEKQRAFFARHPDKRKQKSERQRQKRRTENLMHPKEPKVKIPPPPCGGDCEVNCPYDGVCRYPEWEEDWEADRWKRKWAEIKSDQKKLAHERETHRKASKKHYRKIRFIKAGGSPARFEAIWAKAGGDPEVFKTMTEQQEEGWT